MIPKSYAEPKLYRVHNPMHADILLPYPSCDEIPKDVLLAGHCVLADDRLVDALHGYIEILEELSPVQCEDASDCSPENVPEQVDPPQKSPLQENDVFCFLEAWWATFGPRFVRIGQILPFAFEYWPDCLADCEPGSSKCYTVLGKIVRLIEDKPPRGWAVTSRRRSNTKEYRLHCEKNFSSVMTSRS